MWSQAFTGRNHRSHYPVRKGANDQRARLSKHQDPYHEDHQRAEMGEGPGVR
jgi:hypothetical protein